MKNNNLSLKVAVVAAVVLLSSCSRVYWSRDYVKAKDQAKNEKVVKNKDLATASIETKTGTAETPALVSSTENLTPSFIENRSIGQEVKAETRKAVKNIGAKKMDNIKSDVKNETLSAKGFFNPEQAEKEAKRTAEGKSQLIALILAILVGTLGIHRFYLGYTGIGIIQLLTLGGCGIWTLIDIILIAMGDLKPKDGEYDETL